MESLAGFRGITCPPLSMKSAIWTRDVVRRKG
jgi:hypothetical protein